MMDVTFVSLYFLFPFFVVVGMKKTGMQLFEASIPSFVVLSMFAFAYIGTLPLYFGWIHYRYVMGVQDKFLVLQVLLMTSWSILTMIIGFLFARDIFHFKDYKKNISYFRPLNPKEIICLYLWLIFCLGVLYVYLTKVPSIALFVALKNGVKEATIARSLMGNDFAGKYHRYSFFMHDCLTLVTFSLFAHWLIRKNHYSLFVFLTAFLFSTFTAVMATEKAPFAWFVIGLFLTYTLVLRHGKIPVRSLVKLGVSLVVPLIFFYIYFMGSNNPFSAMRSIFSRSFTGCLQAAYHHLEFIPTHHDFLMGRSFPNPGGVLPFEPYPLAVELMRWRFPAEAASGVVGSSPTVFWGEMYANFGLLGVFIAPLFVGVGLYSINFLVFKLENTPLKVGLVVWMLLHYRTLAVTGLSGFIFDIRMIVICVLVVGIIFLSNNGKIKYNLITI